jgi:hypothetical protein
MNKIKNYFNNRSARNFGRRYNNAVKNLGGIKYATIESKQNVLAEMDSIKKNKRNEIKHYVIGAIIGFLISLLFFWLNGK